MKNISFVRKTVFLIILMLCSFTSICQSFSAIVKFPDIFKTVSEPVVNNYEWIIAILIYAGIRVFPTKVSLDPIVYALKLLNKIIPDNVKDREETKK